MSLTVRQKCLASCHSLLCQVGSFEGRVEVFKMETDFKEEELYIVTNHWNTNSD